MGRGSESYSPVPYSACAPRVLRNTRIFQGWYTGHMNLFELSVWSYIVIVPLVVWSLFWKALALWHAAKQGNRIWFVVLFLVNTLGILDIIYLIVIGKLKTSALFEGAHKTDDSRQSK